MTLPRLAREFMIPGCFTLREAESLVGAKKAREHVRYLLKRGYIETVRRGLYAFDPNKTGALPDRYVIASKVSQKGYLSHHTALELLGVAQTTHTNVIYLTVSKRISPFALGGTRFQPLVATRTLPGPDLLARVKRGGQDLRVSGRELTLVQCLDQLRYAGGLDEVLSSVEGFSSLHWDRLEGLIHPVTGTYGKSSLNSKVGFVLWRNAQRWHVPDGLLDRLARRTGKGITYLGTSRGRGGHWVPEWRVIVPSTAMEV